MKPILSFMLCLAMVFASLTASLGSPGVSKESIKKEFSLKSFDCSSLIVYMEEPVVNHFCALDIISDVSKANTASEYKLITSSAGSGEIESSDHRPNYKDLYLPKKIDLPLFEVSYNPGLAYLLPDRLSLHDYGMIKPPSKLCRDNSFELTVRN